MRQVLGFEFDSRSEPGTRHIVTVTPEGEFSCTCNGMTSATIGYCTHVRQVAFYLQLPVIVRA